MRKDDNDALSLWLKYYPDKAKNAYLAMQDALNRTSSTAVEVGESVRKMATAINAAAHTAATQPTNPITKSEGKKPEKVAEPVPAQEYNLTEVKSDMKFDWEEPKFTSMTEI